MLGGLGSGMVTIFTLALGAIVGGIALTYAAHCFLVVTEQTAAGADQVIWPDEPFVDWMWKGFYIVWIAAAWLAPAWLIARAVAPHSLVSFLLVAALLFGMIFPVSVLSSLSASSAFVLIRWEVIDRLFRCGGRLAAFYLTSGLLLATGAFLVGFAFPAWTALQERVAKDGPGWLAGFLEVWSWVFVLPLTALEAGIVILLYGRLLGRLAWFFNRVVTVREKRVDRLPIARPHAKPKEEEMIETAVVVEETAAIEAPATAPSDYETGTYGVVEEKPNPLVERVSVSPSLPRLPPDPDEDPRRPLPAFFQPELLGFLFTRPALRALAWLTFWGTILAFVIRVEMMVL